MLVDRRRLVGDPIRFPGQNLLLEGKALTVEQQPDATWMHLLAGPPDSGPGTGESIAVIVRPRNSAPLKEECYRVYGSAAGAQAAQRAITGASARLPVVTAYAVAPGQCGVTSGLLSPCFGPMSR